MREKRLRELHLTDNNIVSGFSQSQFTEFLQSSSFSFPTICDARRRRLWGANINKIKFASTLFKVALKFAASDCHYSRRPVVRETVREDQANIIENFISSVVLKTVDLIANTSEVHRVFYHIKIVHSLQTNTRHNSCIVSETSTRNANIASPLHMFWLLTLSQRRP